MKRASRPRHLLRIAPFAVGQIVREDDGPQYREGEIVSIQADGDVRVRWNDREEKTYLEGDVLDMVGFQRNHVINFNRENEEFAQGLLDQKEGVVGEVQVEAPAAEEDQVEVEAPSVNELPVNEDVEEEKEEEQSLGGDYRSVLQQTSSDEESDGVDEDLAPNYTPTRPTIASSTGITPAMRGMRLNDDCEECGLQLPCLFCNRFH